ncbi:MAG: SWIM zinc finger family protein [Pyrinomonadaceae bacterium]
MIELKSTEQLSKAIKRAKTSSLFVRFVQFRQFRVENRANERTYNVNFFVRAGKRFGHCDCKGGERGLACKHIAAAAAVQTGIAAMRLAH